MKKILFSLLFLLVSITSFAQTEKGSWLLGGAASLGTSSSSVSSSSQTSIIIQPKVGYFLIDNLTLGASLPFSYGSSSGSSLSSTSFGIAPFLRYFFLNGKVKPFLEVEGGYSSISVSGSNNSYYNTVFGAGGGLAIFLTKSAALDLSLNYRTYNYNTTTSGNYNISTTGNTFGLQVGFLVYLGGSRN
jgi:outer membrane protein